MTFPVWPGNNEALAASQPSYASYTALDGGAADGAPVLNAYVNLISTVGTDGDSVTLPVATEGSLCHVANWNGTENGIKLYASGTDTVAGASSLSIGAYTSMLFLNAGGEPANWVIISYVNWD